jgi:hypothetical protein
MGAPIDRLAHLHLAGDRAATKELARVAARMGVHPDSLWGCNPGLPRPPLTIPDFIAAYRERLKVAVRALGFRPHKAIPGKFLLGATKGDTAHGTEVSSEVIALMCSPLPHLGLPVGVYDVALHGRMPIIYIDGEPHIKGERKMYVSIGVPPPLSDLGYSEAQCLAVKALKENLERSVTTDTSTVSDFYFPRYRVGLPQNPKYYCRLSWKKRPMSWYCTMKGNERGAHTRCFPHVPRPMCGLPSP